MYTFVHPVPPRGALAIVTNEGRVAVDAGSAGNERHESVRQRRVVLTPRCWRRRWQQYMAHRGDHVISRKAIAQGMSDVLRFTCMLMRALLVHIAHETAGAARIRHSLRPLISRGRYNFFMTRTQCAARMRMHIRCRPRAC